MCPQTNEQLQSPKAFVAQITIFFLAMTRKKEIKDVRFT
jgi:hypothetical protein